MQKILSPKELDKHVVLKYNFKKLEHNTEQKDIQKTVNISPNTKEVEGADKITQEAYINPSKEMSNVISRLEEQNKTFANSLLKKIDELSSMLAKSEIKFEKQENEFKERLKAENDKAYLNGKEDGKKELKEETKAELDTLKAQILHSIEKIKTTADDFIKISANMEKELVDAALDIAKEVIAKEVEKNSAKIAHSLASELIKNVKEAMKIKIKVNPEDLDYLKEKFSTNDIIEILPDSAIARGGIIIQSDAGNVDGTIATRLQNVKKNIMDIK